nr:LptF/LptG family permease [Azospirillum picis]
MIDRYILSEASKPLAISLVVVLTALILERILRLFDLLADQGKQFGQILTMAANLVPHYLGLALPAAFFISIFLVSARFSEDSEIDALRGCGISLRRFGVPFLGAGVVLALFSIALYGYIQPYSRYAYREIFYAVTNAPWDATIKTATFIDTGGGYTIYADRMSPDGDWLEHVFVHQKLDDGGEITTTAKRGDLRLSDDGQRMTLAMREALQIRKVPGKQDSVLAFDRLVIERPFSRDIPLFRARGDSERELTMSELRDQMRSGAPSVTRSRLRAEFHARLVRSVSLPLLPMLAVPMGMAAKRARRWQGIATSAVILLLYHHAIQLGESLADLGRADPLLSLWGPFALFAAGCILLYAVVDRGPGANPFGGVFEAIDMLFLRLRRLLPHRRRTT